MRRIPPARRCTCSYDENGTDPWPTSPRWTPRARNIEWDLDGPDAGNFTIDGGVLPSRSLPTTRTAVTQITGGTVRATEVLGEDDAGPAEYTEVMVTVNIENLDEDGQGHLRLQAPQEGVTVDGKVSQMGTTMSHRLGNGLCRRS